MTTFALLSELHRLTPDEIIRVDHIIADDGDWSEGEITHYINQWNGHNILHPERYKDGEDEREGLYR